MSEAKALVSGELLRANFNAGKLSVKRGNGTARRWLRIRTEHNVPKDLKLVIENLLLDNELVGTYTDDGPGEITHTCVNWSDHSGSNSYRMRS